MAEEPPPNLLNVVDDVDVYEEYRPEDHSMGHNSHDMGHSNHSLAHNGHDLDHNVKDEQPPQLTLESDPQEDESCGVIEEEVLDHDDMIEVDPPQLQAQAPSQQDSVVRRVIRRVRIDPETDPVEGTSAGIASSSQTSMNNNNNRRVYIRRKRTPEEELALDRYEQELNQQTAHRIPAPPGKRGRRPLMLSHADTEPVSRTEAARRTGRPVVVHPSGVEFAIPVSLEAHPVQLSDTIPDNPDFDILKDNQGMPYCSMCHCVVRTFNALEYHVMSVHLKYRPYRCMYCVKEHFFTEEECMAHLKSAHSGKSLSIIREVKEDKEAQLKKFFQAIFVMIREGEDLTEERVAGLQQAAYHQMQKYHRMRFKVPEVVARQRSQKDASAQTFVTMAAPQTMVTMPMRPSFMRPREEAMAMKVVRLPNGDYAQLEDDRYVVDRGMDMGDGAEYDQIDVVDAEDHMVHHHY